VFGKVYTPKTLALRGAVLSGGRRKDRRRWIGHRVEQVIAGCVRLGDEHVTDLLEPSERSGRRLAPTRACLAAPRVVKEERLAVSGYGGRVARVARVLLELAAFNRLPHGPRLRTAARGDMHEL